MAISGQKNEREREVSPRRVVINQKIRRTSRESEIAFLAAAAESQAVRPSGQKRAKSTRFDSISLALLPHSPSLSRKSHTAIQERLFASRKPHPHLSTPAALQPEAATTAFDSLFFSSLVCWSFPVVVAVHRSPFTANAYLRRRSHSTWTLWSRPPFIPF